MKQKKPLIRSKPTYDTTVRRIFSVKKASNVKHMLTYIYNMYIIIIIYY